MLIKTVNIAIQTTNIKTSQIYKIIIVTDTIKSVPNLVIICFILAIQTDSVADEGRSMAIIGMSIVIISLCPNCALF